MKTPALSGRRRLTRTDDGVGCGVGYGHEARLSIGYTRPHRRRILGYTPRPRRRLLGQGLHTPLVGPRFGFVDVVAPTDGTTLIAGEAKFTDAPVGYDVLAGLEDDVAHPDWTPTGSGEPTYEFAVFGRSGSSRSVEEAAA